MTIPLSKPDIGEAEIKSVVDVLHSGRLSLGPKLVEFEQKFAAYLGMRHAVAMNSGTSALHLAIRALGIGSEDEVITTPFSFAASTNCFLYEGASPIFIDIDPATMNLDVQQLQSFLSKSCEFDSRVGLLFNRGTGRVIKAILPVHVFGMPCEMDAIMSLASQYKLHVIEDACEALGADYYGQKAGTFGDVAVFGFYPNKQLTTGEGGMLVTNNDDTANLCRSMRNQGRDDNWAWLSHARLGYNYRLSELHSALGLAQLERLNELLTKRERVAAAYKAALSDIPCLLLPQEVDGLKRSWFVFVVQLDLPEARPVRDRVLKKLRERGVECQVYFPVIHRLPYMAAASTAKPNSLQNAETISDRSLAIPFFPSMTSQEVETVSSILREVLDEEVRTEAPSARKSAASASGS